MTMERIPTALELNVGELLLLREIVARGFMPGRQAETKNVAKLLALHLVQSGMGGLMTTPAGRIVARL